MPGSGLGAGTDDRVRTQGIADAVTMQELAGQAASGEHYRALRRLAVLFGVLRETMTDEIVEAA